MTVENPYDALHTVNLVTQCLSIPIITVFVAMRFGIRTWYKQFVLVEDSFCLIAWALFMAYCGIGIVVGKYGGGYHFYDVSNADMTKFRMFCYIATAVYCPMALFTKFALLSILIRIFKPYKSKIIFIYVLLGCLTVYYITAEGIKLGMCNPVEAYWTGAPAFCLDQQAALLSDSVISVVTDLIILILPLPLTWSLQMKTSKKLRVIGMLSAGGLATAFSVYRLVLVIQQGSSKDMTMVFVCVIMSGNAEGGVGLICACLPTLNILIAHVKKHGYSSNRYYNQHDSSMQLSKMRAANSKGFSNLGSKSDREPEYGSDQSHLITYAGAVDSSATNDAGIYKSVDVSQKVEMVGDPKGSHERY